MFSYGGWAKTNPSGTARTSPRQFPTSSRSSRTWCAATFPRATTLRWYVPKKAKFTAGVLARTVGSASTRNQLNSQEKSPSTKSLHKSQPEIGILLPSTLSAMSMGWDTTNMELWVWATSTKLKSSLNASFHHPAKEYLVVMVFPYF